MLGEGTDGREEGAQGWGGEGTGGWGEGEGTWGEEPQLRSITWNISRSGLS